MGKISYITAATTDPNGTMFCGCACEAIVSQVSAQFVDDLENPALVNSLYLTVRNCGNTQPDKALN